MIIVWIRNAVLLLIVLTITYAIVSYNLRQKHRDKLTDEYDTSGTSDDKNEFVAKGMMNYRRSYRPKLILGIFLLPILVLIVLLYLAHRS